MTFPNCCCQATQACKCFLWRTCTSHPTPNLPHSHLPPLTFPAPTSPSYSELVASRVEVTFPHEYHFAETFEKVLGLDVCSVVLLMAGSPLLPSPLLPSPLLPSPPLSSPLLSSPPLSSPPLLFSPPLPCLPTAPGCQEVPDPSTFERKGGCGTGRACATRFVLES